MTPEEQRAIIVQQLLAGNPKMQGYTAPPEAPPAPPLWDNPLLQGAGRVVQGDPQANANFAGAVAWPVKTVADAIRRSNERMPANWWPEELNTSMESSPMARLGPVSAQARQWGLFAPQTGVSTPVGAPKLELLAQAIWDRALRLGVDPRKLRDDVLTGKGHAAILAAPVGGAGAMWGQDNGR